MLQQNATDYPIPIFFSETGCNVPPPRTFDDQSAIFGPEMSNTWSGAIIYEWIEETNDYGLISYGAPALHAPATNKLVVGGYTRQGVPTPVQPDFNNLKSQWAAMNPTGTALSAYKKAASSITGIACPASTSGGWAVDPSSPLPTLGQTYMKDSSSATATAGSSGNKGSSGSSATASATGKHNAGRAVMVVGNMDTERLLTTSMVLSVFLGALACWL